jgi:aspartate carbamoyltransferase catalytic subunit
MKKIRHVIDTRQWDREGLEELFGLAREMQDSIMRRYPKSRRHAQCLQGYLMASLFYEPSTRTRFSHEAAMLRLGGRVLSTENAEAFSSVSKGETLEDTIRMASSYCDVIVIRHREKGAAARAAAVSSVPVINAGDGPGQHPTQALLDVFTIENELGGIDGKTIAFVGDLAHGRTVRSLAYLLGKFQPTGILFVAHEVVRMKADIKEYLDRHGVPWEEVDDLADAARRADVLYVTRIQKERFGDRIAEYHEAYGRYVVTPATLAVMKPRSIVMHPLPRVNEIAVEVDNDPRAAYFRQAKNGLFVRMALLHNILNQDCH